MKHKDEQDLFLCPGQIILEYKYAVGSAGSRFLTELRDNGKIMGIKCPECDLVYVPPRQTCERCFSIMKDWIELDGKGTLKTYTVVHYSEPYHPGNPPVIYGLVHLDGADTDFLHILGEVESENLKIGVRVGPVFKDKREGNILDIKYFRPL